ncbi:DUF4249 domain-containing protein [Lutimonas zeaxanthinifaciens]|uniref:DUF4249 domain-containing protein n=1 Tax=Lutimonas zeaxanthinifaciens TaxID=3060215 RepID=UPI00265CEEAA|nr:DUF4249 domain-containing protein [Lutimonas sp. YSD2104]WKK65512.1 DUF4249 domain-containing protein [Lutimonas sp. YSD2104]
MKNYIYILVFALNFIFYSCTDVIDVDVPVAPPRLVIEASMDWVKGTDGSEQLIKLSTSTPYFENLQETPVTGASVKVINDSDLTEFIFTDQNNGTYTTGNFIPALGQSYTLEILYDNEIYRASETMTAVTEITSVFQSRDNGFDKNALEVNIEWNDPADIENFYLTKFKRRGDLLQTLFDLKDEFTNGNRMTIFYEKLNDDDSGETEFQPGDVVDIYLHGISEQYYNYIRLLIQQSGGPGGPFSTTPAEIKGNCINISNPENYAFGYFRLTEVDKKVYIFE